MDLCSLFLVVGVWSGCVLADNHDFSLEVVSGGRNETLGGGRSLGGGFGGNGVGDTSTIVFPEEMVVGVPRRKGTPPPLHLLRRLAVETDFEQIVRAYVDNVDIQRDVESGNNILVDRLGNPLKDKEGQKVVTSYMAPPRGVPIMNPGTSISSSSVYSLSAKGSIKERLQTQQQRTSAATKPPYTSAECRPQETTVELPVEEPNVIYYPRCVRVDRCGGCCGSDLLVCEPTAETVVHVDVKKFEYIGDGSSSRMNMTGVEKIGVAVHKGCTCNCRVKASDCSRRHEYVESDCGCKCKNASEHERCVLDVRKVWDVSTCSCLCREIRDCNSGFGFDHVKTCECVELKTSGGGRKVRGRPRRKTQ